jgi:hypothetical protein
MRPFALKVDAGDFALAMGYRRIAISLLAGILKHLRWPPQILTRDPSAAEYRQIVGSG